MAVVSDHIVSTGARVIRRNDVAIAKTQAQRDAEEQRHIELIFRVLSRPRPQAEERPVHCEVSG